MEQVKVFFELGDNIDNAGTESLWATKNEDGSLTLDNIPFHVNGVSLGDVISIRNVNDTIYFNKLIKKSGHSTYRIIQLRDDPKENFNEYWNPIAVQGATCELKLDGDRSLYAVDIPPSTDILQVYKLLEVGEADGIWHFEEADYSRRAI